MAAALALQRQAGNAAVSRLLATPVIQRRVGHKIDVLHDVDRWERISDFRGAAPVGDGRNVAEFEHPGHAGNSTMMASDGPGRHSEQLIDTDLGVNRNHVTHIHSEYEPCAAACETLVRNSYITNGPQIPEAEVTWYYDYQPGDPKEQEERKQRKDDRGWLNDAKASGVPFVEDVEDNDYAKPYRPNLRDAATGVSGSGARRG